MYRKIFKLQAHDNYMKIREVLDKKVGDREYTRYIVILPKDVVKKSKLKGKELKAVLDNERICLVKENQA